MKDKGFNRKGEGGSTYSRVEGDDRFLPLQLGRGALRGTVQIAVRRKRDRKRVKGGSTVLEISRAWLNCHRPRGRKQRKGEGRWGDRKIDYSEEGSAKDENKD